MVACENAKMVVIHVDDAVWVEWSGGVYVDDDHGNGGGDADANDDANAVADADADAAAAAAAAAAADDGIALLLLVNCPNSNAISDRSRPSSTCHQ